MRSQRKNYSKYPNLFIYSSEQFCGNNEKYFSHHCEKLVVFIIQPRLKNSGNKVRLYRYGELVEEKTIALSQNIFLYYLLWYSTYIKMLFHYFSFNEKFYVISFHPLNSFGIGIIQLLRHVKIIYWIGDYFPANGNFPVLLYEKLKRYLNSKLQYVCYLGDGINKIMNGKIINTKNKKTILWGVDPKNIKHTKITTNKRHTILFIGQIHKEQGLSYFIDFLKVYKNYSLQILGVCPKEYYNELKQLIKKNEVTKQVFFPNKFFSDEEVQKIAKKCDIGIALYSTSDKITTFYTDPGKVKAYAELGIPVIMSDTSAVAPYIKKFKSGEVIPVINNQTLTDALTLIFSNYNLYRKGLEKFNKYFYYEDYYGKHFKFLESL